MRGADRASEPFASQRKGTDRAGIKVYLVGGGIASLAAAAFMIRDGDVIGANITIFEELGKLGGSLDGSGSPQTGYVLRRGAGPRRACRQAAAGADPGEAPLQIRRTTALLRHSAPGATGRSHATTPLGLPPPFRSCHIFDDPVYRSALLPRTLI